jgi:hypothetical protein
LSVAAPQNVLVGVFDSDDQARRAHAKLLEQGFAQGEVGLDTPSSRGGERGFAGVVARMFSGFLMDDDPRGRAYAERLSGGGGIVVLHGVAEHDEARASSILREHGAQVDRHAPLHAGEPTGRSASGSDAALEAATASIGPRAYVLPNAPTDWGRFTGRSPASIGQAPDPARPQGELDDAAGLDSAADRTRLERPGQS